LKEFLVQYEIGDRGNSSLSLQGGRRSRRASEKVKTLRTWVWKEEDQATKWGNGPQNGKNTEKGKT